MVSAEHPLNVSVKSVSCGLWTNSPLGTRWRVLQPSNAPLNDISKVRKRRQKLLYEVLSEIQEGIVSNAINPSNRDDVVYLEANPIKELIGRLAVDRDLKPWECNEICV